MFLEISQNSQDDTCAGVSSACNFIKKETLALVFSCKFWEISKNYFFLRTPLVAASESRSVPKIDPRFVTFLVGVKESSIIFFLSIIKLTEQDRN